MEGFCRDVKTSDKCKWLVPTSFEDKAPRPGVGAKCGRGPVFYSPQAAIEKAYEPGSARVAMITAGEKIPLDFNVRAVSGGAVREVKFRDLLTQRTIVSVYMRNHTGSCDRQNDSLVAEADALRRAGFGLIALSRDTAGSHLKYAARKNISYTLVSDPEDAFARAADALVEKSMYGRKFIGPARAAFVLAPDGTVLAVAPKVDTANHGAQLRELVRGL